MDIPIKKKKFKSFMFHNRNLTINDLLHEINDLNSNLIKNSIIII